MPTAGKWHQWQPMIIIKPGELISTYTYRNEKIIIAVYKMIFFMTMFEFKSRASRVTLYE